MNLILIQGGMAKTPPKAKKSGGAIVPVADKPQRAPRSLKDDRRGAIVELLLTHGKLGSDAKYAIKYLPPHSRALSASDEKGVTAILNSTLPADDALEAIRVFFLERKSAK